MHTFKKAMKGFTLVELLLVIAILGILAVALLVAINPIEAQKKARDSKRLSDLKTLQILVDQFINDGNAIPATGIGSAAGISSTGSAGNVATAGTITAQNNQPACPSGTSTWLGIDTCKYGNTVPTDPNNNVSRTMVTNAAATPPAATNVVARYRAIISGSNYEIGVMMESTSNAAKVTGDGGDDNDFVETGSDLTLL